MEISEDIFYKIWFPRETQEITIIAPTDEIGLKRREKDYKNYHLFDCIGDRDSVFNVGLLLSRKYPKARIHIEISNNTILPTYNFKKNLVIIGGPGGDEFFDPELNKIIKDFGNHACRKFNKLEPPSKISYTMDCEGLIFDDKIYEAVFEDIKYGKKISKIMRLDYGYFSAFPNDFDPAKSRVVMIHGIHTLGVLGATKVFDDDDDIDTINNYKTLKSKLGDDIYSFETFFKVIVDGYTVLNPIIEYDKILKYDEVFEENKTPNNVFLSHSSKDRDQTLRIKSALEEKGISTFMAPWDMEVGDWKPQIKTKIKHEDLKILVLVLTEDSQESEVVEYEIKTAIDEGKEIIAFQSENFKIRPSFGLLINGKHNVLAYNYTHKKPVDELARLITNYLKNV